jgi:hypothetical protein
MPHYVIFLSRFTPPENCPTALTPSVIELFDADSKEHDARSLVLAQVLSVRLFCTGAFTASQNLLFRRCTIEAAP